MVGAGAKRILVMELDAAVARLVRKYLTRAGYLVDDVPDCDALPRITVGSRYDLVLASVESLGPSPGTAIARFQKAGVPLLVMTAGSVQEAMDKVISMGAHGPLPKPFDPEVLVARIQDILR